MWPDEEKIPSLQCYSATSQSSDVCIEALSDNLKNLEPIWYTRYVVYARLVDSGGEAAVWLSRGIEWV